MVRVLFYACADRKYEHFAPLFACSTFVTAPYGFVEIGLEDAEAFEAKHARALEPLRRRFPNRLKLRTVDFSQAIPNTVRFLVEPETPGNFIYISDIDLIVLDARLAARHTSFMRQQHLPYSNSVRPRERDKLTGLHFTRRIAHWPLPDLSDIDLRTTNDERVLYQIVKRRGHRLQDEVWWRPVPGLHLSPNRDPLPIDGKGLHWGLSTEWRDRFNALIASPAFCEIRDYLDPSLQESLRFIEAHYARTQPAALDS